MRALALGIVALLLGCVATTATAPEEKVWTRYDKDQRAFKEVWVAACRQTNYSCTGLRIPRVRRNDLMEDYGMRGLYMMGNILYVEQYLSEIQFKLTAFHEAVHYLQMNDGRMQAGGAVAFCVLEFEAMNETNLYATWLQLADSFMRTEAEFKKIYGC